MTIHTYMDQIQYLYILESINGPRYVYAYVCWYFRVWCIGMCTCACVYVDV